LKLQTKETTKTSHAEYLLKIKIFICYSVLYNFHLGGKPAYAKGKHFSSFILKSRNVLSFLLTQVRKCVLPRLEDVEKASDNPSS
jgi:hypothetical protein